MELRHCTAFIAVAEELHFGRAAESLHIAQPALSQMIRSLERELGVPLFERTTRRVRLTASGEALLGPARSIVNQVEGAKRIAQAAQEGVVGRVQVASAGPAAIRSSLCSPGKSQSGSRASNSRCGHRPIRARPRCLSATGTWIWRSSARPRRPASTSTSSDRSG